MKLIAFGQAKILSYHHMTLEAYMRHSASKSGFKGKHFLADLASLPNAAVVKSQKSSLRRAL